MFTIPIVPFKCKTQKFLRLSQSLYQISRHSSTLLVSLFSSSARYASKILHDFISVNLAFISLLVLFFYSLHEDFIGMYTSISSAWHIKKFSPKQTFTPIESSKDVIISLVVTSWPSSG